MNVNKRYYFVAEFHFNRLTYVDNIFRAKDIVKISLIPSHNAANINNGSQNSATQIDEQIFNKINIASKEAKPATINKYV